MAIAAAQLPLRIRWSGMPQSNFRLLDVARDARVAGKVKGGSPSCAISANRIGISWSHILTPRDRKIALVSRFLSLGGMGACVEAFRPIAPRRSEVCQRAQIVLLAADASAPPLSLHTYPD
jgi:hypothetical protein